MAQASHSRVISIVCGIFLTLLTLNAFDIIKKENRLLKDEKNIKGLFWSKHIKECEIKNNFSDIYICTRNFGSANIYVEKIDESGEIFYIIYSSKGYRVHIYQDVEKNVDTTDFKKYI